MTLKEYNQITSAQAAPHRTKLPTEGSNIVNAAPVTFDGVLELDNGQTVAVQAGDMLVSVPNGKRGTTVLPKELAETLITKVELPK